jgi:transposase-like protein
VRQIHSIDLVPTLGSLQRRRSRAASPPIAVNDNAHGAGHCPACRKVNAVAPAAFSYRGGGIIHHHWHCHACGHEWTTVLHVSM